MKPRTLEEMKGWFYIVGWAGAWFIGRCIRIGSSDNICPVTLHGKWTDARRPDCFELGVQWQDCEPCDPPEWAREWLRGWKVFSVDSGCRSAMVEGNAQKLYPPDIAVYRDKAAGPLAVYATRTDVECFQHAYKSSHPNLVIREVEYLPSSDCKLWYPNAGYVGTTKERGQPGWGNTIYADAVKLLPLKEPEKPSEEEVERIAHEMAKAAFEYLAWKDITAEGREAFERAARWHLEQMRKMKEARDG